MDAPGLSAAPRPFKVPESVLVVIHTPALDVLLIQRADAPDTWQSVTGSKDTPDEPIEHTAMREVAEETGIVVGSPAVPREALVDWQLRHEYEIWTGWRWRYAPGVTRNTEHVFGLCVPPRTPIVLAPHEHLAWRWLPWQEAAQACRSATNADAIRRLAARR